MSFPDLEDLDRVNEEVNALPYVSNAARKLDENYWERITSQGGICIDYVLEKIRRLAALGWPVASLRIGCVYVETHSPDNYHAVLVVSTSKGDRLLDSRQMTVCTIGDLARIGYYPDRIQATGGHKDWVSWRWGKA